MLKFSPRFAALVAVILLASASAASAQDKLDRSLRDGKRAGHTQRVILKARPGYSAWVRDLLSKHGVVIDAELPSIEGIAAELDPRVLKAICEDSNATIGCSADPEISPSGLT